MAATLQARSLVRWSGAKGSAPWPEPPEIRRVSLDLARPSLLRLLLRALHGVGARADVMCELLADGEVWLSATDLARLGYTKRNVSRILSEFQQAVFVDGRVDGNILRYRISHVEALSSIVGSKGLSQPRWKEIFALVVAAMDLAWFTAVLVVLAAIAVRGEALRAPSPAYWETRAPPSPSSWGFLDCPR